MRAQGRSAVRHRDAEPFTPGRTRMDLPSAGIGRTSTRCPGRDRSIRINELLQMQVGIGRWWWAPAWMLRTPWPHILGLHRSPPAAAISVRPDGLRACRCRRDRAGVYALCAWSRARRWAIRTPHQSLNLTRRLALLVLDWSSPPSGRSASHRMLQRPACQSAATGPRPAAPHGRRHDGTASPWIRQARRRCPACPVACLDGPGVRRAARNGRGAHQAAWPGSPGGIAADSGCQLAWHYRLRRSRVPRLRLALRCRRRS